MALGSSKDRCYPHKVKVLGVDITGWSPRSQFAVVTSAVLCFFVLFGWAMEALFSVPAIKPHALFVTFIQFGLYSLFGWMESRLSSGQTVARRTAPMKLHNLCAFLAVATTALSHGSLEFLNYPTQVIFKSCKLIPVLLGGILIQGKKYGLSDFIGAALMGAGLIWFTLVDVSVSPNFHLAGVAMISLALMADAVIGNVQEQILKEYGASNCEMVFYSHSIGLLYLSIALSLSGKLPAAVQVAQEYPAEIFGYGFLLSLTGYLGLNLVLTLVRVAGAFTVATVTTCRKAITIAVSFIAFSKPFSVEYVWSGLVLLLGLHWKMLTRRLEPEKVFARILRMIGIFLSGLLQKHINPIVFLEEGRTNSIRDPSRIARWYSKRAAFQNPYFQRRTKELLDRINIVPKLNGRKLSGTRQEQVPAINLDKILERFHRSNRLAAMSPRGL